MEILAALCYDKKVYNIFILRPNRGAIKTEGESLYETGQAYSGL